MLKNLLLSTFLSLRAHKLRVFLTMVGIIIGITAVVTVSSIGEGMKQSSLKLLESADANSLRLKYKVDVTDDEIAASKEFDEFGFSLIDMKTLRRLDNVDNVSADYSMGFGSSVQSIDSNIAFFEKQGSAMIMASKSASENKVAYGRDFSAQDTNKYLIILTYDTMLNALQIQEPKQILGKAIDVDGLKFQVVGIKEKNEDSGMMVSSETDFLNAVPKGAFNELAKSKPINAVKLRVKDGADRQAVVDQANKLLKESHPDLVGVFEEDKSNEEMRQEMESMLQTIVMGLIFITAISLLVGGIGVMNIMYVSVSERKREIGIRRAIGAKPSSILAQFLLEAAFITLIGGIIGILLGWGIASLITWLTPMEAIVSLKMALISAGISAGIGLFFGVIPAINAAKMDPIKAIYQ
ncbi:ABC transporter permease [Vagococcus vulneris]|uniref:ABC transporter permease n=1 Tax=Vagococcus vulneris TaxID=1977869 RepID=A0A429ZWP5_9ENTE|nr:FtsX-like permease family protein [Vagococcus vulneris]RST98200.1 hypothetical protein CBF37_08505 [Vagococcus vulneris]